MRAVRDDVRKMGKSTWLAEQQYQFEERMKRFLYETQLTKELEADFQSLSSYYQNTIRTKLRNDEKAAAAALKKVATAMTAKVGTSTLLIGVIAGLRWQPDVQRQLSTEVVLRCDEILCRGKQQLYIDAQNADELRDAIRQRLFQIVVVRNDRGGTIFTDFLRLSICAGILAAEDKCTVVYHFKNRLKDFVRRL